MSSVVRYEKRDGIGLIILQNPPVNALSQAVRTALLEIVAAAHEDPGVDALLLVGEGRQFSGGADIHEFGNATRPPPHLRQVIRAFDRSDKPIVAAIHGVAFGGALELAMACHYRAAAPDATLALSEVKFGIIPGAGGTQLLPRLVGPAKALEMITTGDGVDGQEAAALGLVDVLIEGDPVVGAFAFAREVAARRPLPRASQRTDRLAAAADLFDAARAGVDKRARGAPAPRLALAAVSASVDFDFDQGLERERELWAEAAASPESEAMRYVFTAERNAAKVPGLPDRAPARRRIGNAAVIGTGTMGTGIANALANAGIEVLLVGRRQNRARSAKNLIARRYAAAVENRKLSAAERRARLARIVATTTWARLRRVDLAFETVIEDLDVKKAILARLETTCPTEAILATNTSSLSIDALANGVRRPEQVVGIHLFSPAHATKLVEIVRGAETSLSAIAAGIDLARQLGKFGVVVRGGDGPVSTRMFSRYQREAHHLLLEGALPHEVDAAMVGFGMALGPFATADLAGVDVGARVAKDRDVIGQRLVERGRLGQKTGRGYYRYQPGDRTPGRDPEVESLIADASKAANVERRPIDDSEIVERCVLAIVNEGAAVLDERITIRASDIDVIWVDGYGFPRHRGGPMYYADQIGLGTIRKRLRELERQHGERWRASSLLAWLAGEGVGFGTSAATKERPRQTD